MGNRKSKAGAFQARGTSPLQNCIRNEKSVQASSVKLDESIRDAARILTELPTGMKELKEKGHEARIPDLIALNKCAARDLDSFVAEKVGLDAELDTHVQTRPKQPGEMADYNSRTLSLGNKYVTLGHRMLDTVGKSTVQIIEILTPEADEEVAAIEEEAVV